jgi:hypothetical protein
VATSVLASKDDLSSLVWGGECMAIQVDDVTKVRAILITLIQILIDKKYLTKEDMKRISDITDWFE